MWTLTNNTLLAGSLPILTHTPPTLSLQPDPTAAGIFLHLRAARPAAHWLTPLGIPAATRFAAAFRHEPFWMRPAITTHPALIPIETQVLFAQLPASTPAQPRIALFVPLLDGPARCSLQGTPEGHLALCAETGHPSITTDSVTALFLALQPAGTPLSAFLEHAAAAIAQRLAIKLRRDKPLPDFIDDFGWCTWDAFYREISPEKIRQGLQSFKESGITPKLLILDDGWQSEENLRLTSLAPNEKFHHDLSPTIRMAQEEFAVRHILAWHTLQGYWSGIDPAKLPHYHAAETPRAFSPGILHHFPQANHENWGTHAAIIPPDNIASLFRDYHARLAAQGITGVKVDNQASLEAFASSAAGRTDLYRAYRQALESSAHSHFRGNILHCMSCANDLLYSPTDSSLTRTSTDFWPAKPNTHGTHLWTNALVALWFSHFIHPDWDMFQSALPAPHEAWSEFHAAARALSGGPIYISDKPGMHNADLLRKLTFSDGAIPRLPNPAVISADSLFHDPTTEDHLLQIQNILPRSYASPAAIIGFFNCRYHPDIPAPPLTATLSPEDIPEIAGHDRYLLYFSILNKYMIINYNEKREISLAQSQYELASLIPIENGIALLGLLNKFIPPAAARITRRTKNSLAITLRDAGPLALWSESPPRRIESAGRQIPSTYQDKWLTAQIPSHNSPLLITF